MGRAEREKKAITISVRLTPEQHAIVQQLCRLKHMSQTAYLSTLATEQARKDLLDYAVRAYREDQASLSELATQTGQDVPTIMEAIAAGAEQEDRVRDAFLAAAKSLAHTHQDPEFYALAVQACTHEGLVETSWSLCSWERVGSLLAGSEHGVCSMSQAITIHLSETLYDQLKRTVELSHLVIPRPLCLYFTAITP